MSAGQNYNGFFIQDGDPMGSNESTLQYPGELGLESIAKCNDGIDRTMQRVQNDSAPAVAVTAGMVAWWVTEHPSYRVTPAAAQAGGGRGRVAGIYPCVVSTDYYTLIVKKGQATPVLFVDAPTAAPDATGLFVVPSATNGKADCLAAGSAPTYPPIGKTVGAQDGTTKLANVDVDVYASFA